MHKLYKQEYKTEMKSKNTDKMERYNETNEKEEKKTLENSIQIWIYIILKNNLLTKHPIRHGIRYVYLYLFVLFLLVLLKSFWNCTKKLFFLSNNRNSIEKLWLFKLLFFNFTLFFTAKRKKRNFFLEI